MRHAVIAYARRRGQTHDVAEDVAQETLVKLLRYTRQGRPASLYALALKIAASSLVDRARREARYGEPVNEFQACTAPLPDAAAADRQQLALLEAALKRMPLLRRMVLMRRRIDNHSHSRIAAEFNLSLAAVEKHVVRGLCDLREAVKNDAGDAKVRP